MPPDKRAFYQFHASLIEPWDGPASIPSLTGTVIGAVLDRNGLRPSRFWVTDDGLVVMASEVGVFDIEPGKIGGKGAVAAGPHVSGRHRPRADRERRGMKSGWRPNILCRLVCMPARSTSTTIAPRFTPTPSTPRSSTTSGCSATPPRI